MCKKDKINLVVASSPRFRPDDDNAYLRKLCQQYQIPYIERYNTELFNSQPAIFQDCGHLNDDGAHVYTRLFFNDLKPYLAPLCQSK